MFGNSEEESAKRMHMMLQIGSRSHQTIFFFICWLYCNGLGSKNRSACVMVLRRDVYYSYPDRRYTFISFRSSYILAQTKYVYLIWSNETGTAYYYMECYTYVCALKVHAACQHTVHEYGGTDGEKQKPLLMAET